MPQPAPSPRKRLACLAGFLLFAVILLAVIAGLPLSAHAQAERLAPDQAFAFPGGPDGPIEAGVWLPAPPADDAPSPLIVISHGNGGWYRGHPDTARALADAGFVVAALTHPGDNFRDQSRSTQLTMRAPQLSRLIDYMTRDWSGPVAIDPTRIGAFGFSAGGFTVTSAIGGVSDALAIRDHCTAHPDFFACRLLAMQGIDASTWRPEARDDRIRAAVIAAPALGFSFTDASLASVHIPVQLWQAAGDEILPAPFNVEPIRDRLGARPEYHRVEDAMHYDFLTPCSAGMAAELPDLCRSAPGFDRAAFHHDLNAQVVRFFEETLK
jgi:predicted dienelactone hydrolase